jgi:peptidoglycan/LPS O-acetylase OafA/YrhL
MHPQKAVYFANLDGLRAIAAFSVILYHLGFLLASPNTPFYSTFKFLLLFGGDGGALGVTFFFILSGFLITYLMLNEEFYFEKLNIINFYVRRVLRIWPLYYMTLLIGFAIYPLAMRLLGYGYIEKASLSLFAIFAANFDYIYHGKPTKDLLGVHWSVAVEEQYYLLWPILFTFFSKKKIFPWILILITTLSEIFFIKARTWEMGYFHLASCFRFLSFGALIAFFCFKKMHLVELLFQKINKFANLLIYLSSISMILFQQELNKILPYYKYVYHVLPFLFFGYVIIEQIYSKNSFFKMSSFPIFNWLGRISYGLYLLHMIIIDSIITIFPNSPDYFLLKIIASIFLTILLANFSYKYFEKYFLSLKKKFSIMSH